jgi:hypothetical protein
MLVVIVRCVAKLHIDSHNFAALQDGTVRIWDAKSGQCEKCIPVVPPSTAVLCFGWQPAGDGNIFAVGMKLHRAPRNMPNTLRTA